MAATTAWLVQTAPLLALVPGCDTCLLSSAASANAHACAVPPRPRSLSKISKKRLRQVPAVAQFKRKYGKMAPKLGLCMGVNPCGMVRTGTV